MYQLLRTVRATYGYSTKEYNIISRSTYYDADVNKDGFVSKSEFDNAMITLKNANPVGFSGFLKGWCMDNSVACPSLSRRHIACVCIPFYETWR